MPKRKKLAALDYLEGSPSRKLVQAMEAMQVSSGLGKPFIPDHLTEDAKGCIELVRGSMPDSVYSALDSFHLAAFAVAWSIHKRAAEEIAKPGFEWFSGKYEINPWIRVLNGQVSILSSLGDRLGFDPRSRASIIGARQNSRRSRFDGLLGATKEEQLKSLSSSKN